MSSGINNKRIFLFVIVLAVTPLLFGNAIHRLIPCPLESHCRHLASHSHDAPEDDNGGDDDHEDGTPAESSCPICDFLTMPRDIPRVDAWDFILDLVERREPEAVRLFVVLYRPFEPGRAPPFFS